jgi:hypothetical protein
MATNPFRASSFSQAIELEWGGAVSTVYRQVVAKNGPMLKVRTGASEPSKSTNSQGLKMAVKDRAAHHQR